MFREDKKEQFIKKYQLRKNNGCFDINKAIELEKIFLEVQKDNAYKLSILKELLGDKNE